MENQAVHSCKQLYSYIAQHLLNGFNLSSLMQSRVAVWHIRNHKSIQLIVLNIVSLVVAVFVAYNVRL